MPDEHWVSATRGMLGHLPVANPDKIRQYTGTYRLYRPFHLDPRNYVIVEQMTIGGDSPFACSLTSKYIHEGRSDGAESNGKVVPHGPKLLVLLQVGDDRDANMILFFDRKRHKTVVGGDKKVLGMAGSMIASVGTWDDASAWPCYAELVEVPKGTPVPVLKTEIIPRSGVADLPQDARGELARGAIYWREEDFAYPYGGAPLG